MTVENEHPGRRTVASPTRADFYRYYETPGEAGRGQEFVTIDKTTAKILGAVASAALAIAVAAGTALVQKVDGTARDVENGRAQRIADFGEASKNISVVEAKLNQLIGQVTSLESRTERSLSQDLQLRDRRLDQIEREVSAIRDDLAGMDRDRRRGK